MIVVYLSDLLHTRTVHQLRWWNVDVTSKTSARQAADFRWLLPDTEARERVNWRGVPAHRHLRE